MGKSKLFDAKAIVLTEDISEIDEILEQEEILYTISENIIEYRKKMGITQKDLAKILNVNQTMISKLESGNYNPTFKLIHKITRKLTKSSEMFANILEQMSKNVKRITVQEYVEKIETDKYVQYNYSRKQTEAKIIRYKYNNKGDGNYEEYTGTIENIG